MLLEKHLINKVIQIKLKNYNKKYKKLILAKKYDLEIKLN